MSGCVAVRFDRRLFEEGEDSGQGCSLHFDEGDLESTLNITGIDLYVLEVACEEGINHPQRSELSPGWMRDSFSNRFGGISYRIY